MIKKYRKRPVIVEAIQWDGKEETYFEIQELLASVADCVRPITIHMFCSPAISDNYLYIDTLEGTMKANIGDYIIRGIKGEFYPCKPDIFEQTYEEVKDGD